MTRPEKAGGMTRPGCGPQLALACLAVAIGSFALVLVCGVLS